MSISRLTLIAAAFAVSSILAAPVMAHTRHRHHATLAPMQKVAVTSETTKPVTAAPSVVSTPSAPLGTMVTKTPVLPVVRPATIVPPEAKL